MMVSPRHGEENRNIGGIIVGFLSILILLLTALQSNFVSEAVIVDNGDYTHTATWDFDDLTNYTLSNLTALNGEVNLTDNSYYWNQSIAQDFASGQRINVVGGDGIVTDADDLFLGYLENQNFTTPNNWNYVNGTDSNVISQRSSLESGEL